jgi:cholesterol oxidase
VPLSHPIEDLIQDRSCEKFDERCDVLIVGSGYGGAIAAMRLAGDGRKVFLFERGKEYATGEFPETIQMVPAHVQVLTKNRDLPIGYPDAMFDFRLGNPVSVLVGCGLGGGSLINANVAMEPEDDLFNDPRWPRRVLSRAVLQPHFDAVKTLLGVTTHKSFQKYTALEGLARGMGAACRPAPIAVTTSKGGNQGRISNAVGITQNPCIGCGNCVTGCNVGAKNTLPMNALPLAKSRGARLFTGATVLSVEPDGPVDGSDGWRVRFRRTETSKTVLRREVFTLRASVVILAAGTLGSTEILLRSRERGKVKVSKRLGERFSTNGDALAFGYAQKHEVNAAAEANQPPDQRNIGPTITGFIRADAGSRARPRVTIEDGAVPSALTSVFGEVLATAAVFKRNSRITLPAWFRAWANRAKDPLSVHRGALRNSQVLLVMGDDEAKGKLELEQSEADTPVDPDSSRVRISEPAEGEPPEEEPPVFSAVDRLLEQARGTGGFNGGDYLPNPFWKVFPAELSQASNLPPPGRNLLSVHPLGGCPMGNDVRSGVVNHHGQVFRLGGPRRDSLYKGLYVMDGAIMPCALGVNPFLTIAALAHRNAEAVGRNRGWPEKLDGKRVGQNVAKVAAPPPWNPSPPQTAQGPDKAVHGHFVELLTGRLPGDSVPQWVIDSFGSHAGRKNKKGGWVLNDEGGLVLTVRIDVPDVMGWLQAPNETLKATAKLYVNPGPINPVLDEQLILLGVSNKGGVEFLAWDRPCCCLHQLARLVCAVMAWFLRKVCDDPDRPGGWMQQVWHFLRAGWAWVLRRGWRNSPGLVKINWRKPKEAFRVIIGFLCVAWNAANWRRLSYHFTFGPKENPVELRGTKELAYALGKRDPWTALTELPFTLQGADDSIEGTLQVDLDRLTRRSWFQAEESPDSPATIAAMIGAGVMFLRIVFQTHFWSFGAPAYPQHKIQLNRQPGPILLGSGGRVDPKYIKLSVPKSQEDERRKIRLRLVRYQQDNSRLGTILLIHGLASGSRVFATDTIEENFATYFYRHGYEVWLLDYRVSIALPKRIAEGQWDMDQIGRYDMGKAVERVYKKSGRQPIQVFAHCVGAASLAMGILGGHCQTKDNKPMISALALHAVAPWPVPSPVNRMKANLAAFVRDALTWKTLDAVLPHKPSTFDVMMDRIAGSVPFPPALAGDDANHRKYTDATNVGRNICDRMTLFYGWEWNHIPREAGSKGNMGGLSAETHRKLAELVGVANFETFRHIYFLLTRKRLTTRVGRDTYVKAKNFKKYWSFPTLFAHGRDNQLYDPRSAIASCRRLQDIRKQEGYPPGSTGTYGVYWFEAKPCGHFDFLFGKDASRIVYPSVSAFFQQHRNSTQMRAEEKKAWGEIATRLLETDRDPYWEYSPIPYRGPIIGWTRPHPQNNDTIILRLWVEPYRFSARDMYIGSHNHPHRITIKPRRLPADRLHPVRDYPGTYWVYDLEIPQDFTSDLYVSIENLNKKPWTSRFRVEALDVTRISYDKFKKDLADGNVEEVSISEKFIHGRLRAGADGGQVFRTPRENDPDLPSELEARQVRETDMTGYIWLTISDWYKNLQAKPSPKRTAFLIGSCRYPGSPFDADLADRVFGPMCDQVENSVAEPGVDHVLLVGDQIYADATADIFDTAELRERFAGHYREAFGAPNLRRLLGSVPTYMALDDHEFGDNWTGDENAVPLGDRFVRKFGENFQHGLAAAMAYQWSMSPRTGWQWPPNPPSVHNQGLWYTFDSGGLPFFVMDTRTERTLRRAGISAKTDAHIVGDRQLKALEAWLLAQPKGKPKFIVSGSVLAPFSKTFVEQPWLYRHNDGWAGYPATWRRLVKHIVANQIRKVVFIAGDYHFSAVAKLTLSSKRLRQKRGRKSVRAYQIISSGLFVPLTWANARAADYGCDPKAPVGPYPLPFSDDKARIVVEGTELLCDLSSHFLRVGVNPIGASRWKITANAYNEKGKVVKTISFFVV